MRSGLNLRISFLLVLTALLASCQPGGRNDGEADTKWSKDRTWIGPEHWANPLQDWKVSEGAIVGIAARNRTLHSLTKQVSNTDGGFRVAVNIRLDSNGGSETAAAKGGFRIGLQGPMADYRYALLNSDQWVDAIIRDDGRLAVGEAESSVQLSIEDWIQLSLKVVFSDQEARLILQGEGDDGRRAEVEATFPADRLMGNMALLSDGIEQRPEQAQAATWRFKDWRIDGEAVVEKKDHSFGPILWTQYTLSGRMLKLAALMAPVEEIDEPVELQLKSGSDWREVAQSEVDPLSRTALFRIDDWNESVDTEYRVAYRWQGKAYYWGGLIRKDPKDQETVRLAAFSCDNGYIFPNAKIVANVEIQDPDLLYFAGDQIYESFGGFGIIREPVDLAMLDYLRKYWMFGWSWRELLKDRPSIIIPDDHDVFQGNIWGHGGRKIPNMGSPPSGSDWPKGGYAMHPDWVNAVQRTQTVHFPDPVDPGPAEQGIGVYFTELLYGGLSIAVLEDRKFKSGPLAVFGDRYGSIRAAGLEAMNPSDAELLGSRQEAFLQEWIDQQSEADFKVALSQTIFCKVTTHAGRELRRGGSGFDSGGWPKNKRDRALSILGQSKVVMVHGDQHLGALVHHGIDDWEDGPIGFMVPGTANGFPRAWWPEESGENRQPGEPNWTGRYLDDLGNRITVLAAGNPELGSNEIPKSEIHPEKLGHLKGSGHGIIDFNRSTRESTFELWRLDFDAANPKPEDQFIGFPKTVKLEAN
ncbi:MAG: hypothetical protein CMI15_12895 [Opitutaceae bacterium]|nr:hypothetical protein [Opitutaceae bacterium]